MKKGCYILFVILIVALSARGYRVDTAQCRVTDCNAEAVAADLGHLPFVAQVNADSILSGFFFQRTQTAEPSVSFVRMFFGGARIGCGSFRFNVPDWGFSQTAVRAALSLSAASIYKFHNIRI